MYGSRSGTIFLNREARRHRDRREIFCFGSGASTPSCPTHKNLSVPCRLNWPSRRTRSLPVVAENLERASADNRTACLEREVKLADHERWRIALKEASKSTKRIGVWKCRNADPTKSVTDVPSSMAATKRSAAASARQSLARSFIGDVCCQSRRHLSRAIAKSVTRVPGPPCQGSCRIDRTDPRGAGNTAPTTMRRAPYVHDVAGHRPLL